MELVDLSRYEDFCTWLDLVRECSMSSFYSGDALVHKTYIHIFGTRNFSSGQVELIIWFNSGYKRRKIVLKDNYLAFKEIVEFGNDDLSLEKDEKE